LFWRANDKAYFINTQTIKHIYLLFDEQEQSRTQEFVLLGAWIMKDFFREILAPAI